MLRLPAPYASIIALVLATTFSPRLALAQVERDPQPAGAAQQSTPDVGPAGPVTAQPEAGVTPQRNAPAMPRPGPEPALDAIGSPASEKGANPMLGDDRVGENTAAGGDSAAQPTLPHDLSPWGMFLVANLIVQAVMIGLVIASIVTWTVWAAKSLELAAAKRTTRRALELITDEPTLADAAQKLGKSRDVVGAFIEAAATELKLSYGTNDKSGIKDRVESRLDGLRVAAVRQMNTGTGLLATIGATAPFVGLFGTVWGIMNSFIGISKAQTTNLAVVAPGIAEALLATALGLAAAIPAVIVYNHFSRSIAGYRALVADAAAEVMRQLSRELDGQKRRKLQQAAAAAAAE